MNTNYQFSYWEKDSFFKPYDLIVVGAGIVGLSSALFYKRQHSGARVMVLDKGFLPEGASTRNAGFACVGSVTEHVADLDIESEDGIKKRIQNRYEGLRLLRSTLGEENIGYEACGGYELFTDGDRFQEAAAYIPRFNMWMKELTGEEQVYKADTIHGYQVISNRLEGALHPGKMMQRYIRLAAGAGIELRWNANVSEVHEDGNIILEKGQHFKAAQILVAANGFVQKLLPALSIYPARGFVFVTNNLADMPWKGTFHHDRGYIYFRNIGKRLLVGGARNIDADEESTSEFGTNEKIKNHLLEFTTSILKLEKGWQVEHEWSGIMGFTESKTPVVQKLDSHRYVAAGLSGMGVAVGTKIGQEASALLNDR